MNTQSHTDIKAGQETWVGIDDSRMITQRSGGGFLSLLFFPLIIISALAFAAAELAN